MKIICVGRNYRIDSHVSEVSEAPIVFIKPDTALLTNDKKHFYIPDFTSNVHYEAEIVVKITKMGKNIAERFAHRYYNELTIGLDLTAVDMLDNLAGQGLPWEIAKGFDNSAVVGTFIPVEELNVNNLNFSLLLNGEKAQEANTSEMLNSIDRIIAYVSQYFTLKTGDLIFTGTPAGASQLHIGDELTGFIDGVKLLETKVF